ncbi:hypothetical protein GMYAFLOJ_CDS0078 [Microbacterium phage phiMiGM15]
MRGTSWGVPPCNRFPTGREGRLSRARTPKGPHSLQDGGLFTSVRSGDDRGAT